MARRASEVVHRVAVATIWPMCLPGRGSRDLDVGQVVDASLVKEQAAWSSLSKPGVGGRSAGVSWWAAWRFQIPIA